MALTEHFQNLSQALNVQVPFLFKYAVDELAAAVPSAESAATIVSSAPFGLGVGTILVGYGLVRIGASACNGTENHLLCSTIPFIEEFLLNRAPECLICQGGARYNPPGGQKGVSSPPFIRLEFPLE